MNPITLHKSGSFREKSKQSEDFTSQNFQEDIISKPIEYNSSTQCFINLIKACVGICILDLPFVANQTGFIWSSILLAFMSILTIRTTHYLLDVADDYSKGPISYGEVVHVVLGRNLSRITNSLILMCQSGLCITYIVFFARFFQLGSKLLGHTLSEFDCITIAFFILTPNIFLKSIVQLEKFNTLGVGLAGVSLLGIIYYQSLKLLYGSPAIETARAFNFRTTFLFMSLCFSAIEGNITFLSIRSVYQDKQVRYFDLFFSFFQDFRKIITASISFYALFCIFYSVISILSSGNQLDQLIIFNLPLNNPICLLIIVMYAIQIMLTYPIQISPIHIMIDYQQSKQNINKYYPPLIKLALMILIFFLAYFIPNVSGLLGLMGSVFGSSLTFYIPVACHWVHFQTKSQKKILEYLLILTVATVSLVGGFYQSLEAMGNIDTVKQY